MNSIETINLTNIRTAQNNPSFPLLNLENNLLLRSNNVDSRATQSNNNQLNLVNNNNPQSIENIAPSLFFDPSLINTRNNNNNYISNLSFTLEVSYDEDDDEEEDEDDESNNKNKNDSNNNNNLNDNDNIDDLISLTSESQNGTSVVNSNDICLDTSFVDNVTLLNGLTNRNNSNNLNNNNIRRINRLNQINPYDINISNIHNDINNINNRINEFTNNFTLQNINIKKKKKY